MNIVHYITQQLLEDYSAREAKAISRYILETLYGISQLDICMNKVRKFSLEERQELDFIIKRLKQKEPIQYILNKADFLDYTFYVAPGVLIPRPETEELVKWVIEQVHSSHSENPQILDIGTGSGCIAISLAKQFPISKVTALDISEEALTIAQRNAERLNTSVHFIHDNILNPQITEINESNWDFIVSNPPYIKFNEQEEMEENVLKYEPTSALFVPNDDPLLFYRIIGQYGIKRLKPDGFLFFEINRQYGEETCNLLESMGYTDITLRKDIYDNDRMIKCRKNSL